MQNQHFHAFEYQGEYFLFDTYHYLTMSVTRDFYYSFVNYAISKLSSDKIDKNHLDIIQELENNGYFISKNECDLEQKIESKDIASLSFAPIYQCNFQCRYCFAGNRDTYVMKPRAFDKASVEASLEWFTKRAFRNSTGYRIDFVSGGEPLMNFAAVIAAIEYSQSFYSECGKQIQIWLCTNGSFFSKEVCQILDSNNVSIGVSLDGDKETNDSSRVTCQGKGTYELVVSEIKKVVNDDTLSNKFRKIWGLSVITPKSNMVDILKHHKDIGFNSVQMKLVRSTQRQYHLSPEIILKKYDMFAQWLLSTINNGIEYVLMVINDNDYFGKIIKRVILKEAYIYRCKAGRSKVTICPNGDIYPCDSFVGNKLYLMGNIYTTFSKECIDFMDVSRREKCCSCSIRYLCGGDCYYNSMIHTSNANIPDEETCDIISGLCNIAIWFVFHIEKDFPEEFKQIERILDIKSKISKE